MSIFSAFLAGLLFGIGLIVSDMVSPLKVLAFLDVAGKWDPSLAVAAAAAVAVGVIAFAVARKRTVTLLGTPMRLPKTTAIDPGWRSEAWCSGSAGGWPASGRGRRWRRGDRPCKGVPLRRRDDRRDGPLRIRRVQARAEGQERACRRAPRP
jgi:hypothetical protein